MTRQELIDKTLYQMGKDIKANDYTAIEELLKQVNDEYLRAYLPECEESNQ